MGASCLSFGERGDSWPFIQWLTELSFEVYGGTTSGELTIAFLNTLFTEYFTCESRIIISFKLKTYF